MRASWDRGLAIVLLAATAAAACSGGEPIPTPTSAAATSTPAPSQPPATEPALAPALATQTSTPVPGPLPWNQPRTETTSGVLLLDYGPLEGWDSGQPGAARGALYPLAAATGTTLPGYEPFDLGQASTRLMSPDGRWLGVATSNTQSSGSDLALIDLERWRWGDGLEQMESADTSHIGSFAWSEDGRLAGLRYRGQVIPGSPWVLEPGGRRPLALVEAEVGDLDQWNIIELAPDGSRVHVLGHQSTQCCGIEVQGDPFVATFDLATGTEISRISLPDVLIGQRHETVFESEDEYNILRRPAMVLSADGAHVYIVHADEDRISVVDWAAGSVRTEEIKRPASAFARFGAWLSSHLVTRAEAKGGLSRFKEARPSPDGTQLYVTGISEIACEGMLYTACVAGRPLGLQVIDIESMQLTAEFPDISRIAVSPDGSRLIGIGDESDFREIVNDHALRVGFGATIIDSGSLELIARVEPEVAFEDLAVSPDGQFAYLLSDGPGIDPNASYDCIEACTLLTVVDLSDSTVAATRTFDAITMQLVSIAPPAR